MSKRQKDRKYNGQKTGQTIQWPKDRRTDNTMAKRQDRQYNDQKTEGQTIQWPKDRTDNTMSKRQDRQYNGQKTENTMAKQRSTKHYKET
jgi:hypothetical protein